MGQIHVFGKIVLLAFPDIRDPLARAKKEWIEQNCTKVRAAA